MRNKEVLVRTIPYSVTLLMAVFAEIILQNPFWNENSLTKAPFEENETCDCLQLKHLVLLQLVRLIDITLQNLLNQLLSLFKVFVGVCLNQNMQLVIRFHLSFFELSRIIRNSNQKTLILWWSPFL